MQLELNDDERRALNIALDAHLLSLRNELAHTDDRGFRHMLRERLDRLEHVSEKLGPKPAAKAE